MSETFNSIQDQLVPLIYFILSTNPTFNSIQDQPLAFFKASFTCGFTFNSIQDQHQNRPDKSSDTLRGFQFYPRSTSWPALVSGISLPSFNSIQDQQEFVFLSVFAENEQAFNSIQDQPHNVTTVTNATKTAFNSIQDQLKTYILLLFVLYSYYLINFSYLQSVSPPNSFQYKIM